MNRRVRFKPAESLVQFDVAEASDDGFDKFIEGVLIAILGFCPLAIGGVQAWSQAVFLALCAAAAGALALKLISRADVKFIWSWAYLPMILFILLAVVQYLPLPADWVKVISPRIHERKMELLGTMPGAAASLRWMRLTFYANATAHDLRLLLGVSAVFVVTINVVRRFEQVRKMVIAMTIIGGIFGLIALLQNMMQASMIYGLIRTNTGHANGGPFINQNHAAQFYNLTLGAGLSLLLLTLHRVFRRDDYSAEEIVEKLKSDSMHWGWAAATTAMLSVAAVVLSLSRGGMASMLLACAITGLLAARSGGFSARGWMLSLIALGAFVLVLYAGFDVLFNRLASVRDKSFTSIRHQILLDSMNIWKEYRLLGTGLGTHEVVFPAFSHVESNATFTHAENEYAQMLTETGVVGVSLIGFFLLTMAWNFAGAVRGASSSASSVALGLGCGVLAILFQSATDFSPHFPTVASWLAVSFAILVSLAELRARERKGSVEELPARGHLWMRLIGAGVVTIASAWALWYAYFSYKAEDDFWPARVVEANVVKREWQGSPEEFDVLIGAAQAAVDDEPSNIEYGYWLNMYLWHSIAQQVDPASGDYRMSRGDLSTAESVVAGFKRLRWLAPTYGPAYSMAGQIEHFVLGKTEPGAADIRRGYELGPENSTTNYAAAALDAVEQNWEESRKKLEHTLFLEVGLRSMVVDRLVRTLNRPDVAMQLIGDDLGGLHLLAQLLSDVGKHPQDEQRVQERILELLHRDAASTRPSSGALLELARHHAALKEYAESVGYFQRALTVDYADLNTHYELAVALKELGDFPASLREVKLVLQKAPKYNGALQFQYELEEQIHQSDREKAATQPVSQH